MTTSAEIVEFKHSGSWRILEAHAQGIFHSVEQLTGPIIKRMGDGTRLMLAYEHRISHDIDIFIGDMQYFNYLNPDMSEIPAKFSSYDVNPGSIKLIYPEGEIDFIFAATMLSELKADRSKLTNFDLDPVQEVLFKKLYFRGAAITARDLFDWWAVAHLDPEKFPSEQVMGRLGPAKVAQLRVGITHWLDAERTPLSWTKIAAANKPAPQEVVSWALGQTEIQPLPRTACSMLQAGKSDEVDSAPSP